MVDRQNQARYRNQNGERKIFFLSDMVLVTA